MTIVTKFAGMIVLLALTACASSPGSIPAGGIQAITARVELVDSDRQPLARAKGVSNLVFRFPMILGSIVGNPQSGVVYFQRVRVGESVVLDVNELRSSAAKWASPMPEALVVAGLEISPRTARLARVGTFVHDPVSDEIIAGGSFLDVRTRKGMALVYFAEPCRIRGTLRAGGAVVEHDLTVPSGGLHWVFVSEPSPRRFFIEYAGTFEEAIMGVEPMGKADDVAQSGSRIVR